IVIRNNLIHDVYSYGKGSEGYCIYLGCQTRNCLIENNVVYRSTGAQIIVWFDQRNNTIYNNIIIGEKGEPVNYHTTSTTSHKEIRLLSNIIYYSRERPLYWISGVRSRPMQSDYNLLFQTEGKDISVGGVPGVDTFEDWQKSGFDTHSIIADPLFVDPENDDYSLRPDSPALKLGFKPIDLSRVGLRGRREE
ncbi:hypothetical protein ACFL1G_11355, partial [Planctomycetota bacterium]